MAPQKTKIIVLIFVFVLMLGASYHVGAKPDPASAELHESDRADPWLELVHFSGNTLVISACVVAIVHLAPRFLSMLAFSLVSYNLAQIPSSVYRHGPVWTLLLMMGSGISVPLLFYLYRRFYNPVVVNQNA